MTVSSDAIREPKPMFLDLTILAAAVSRALAGRAAEERDARAFADLDESTGQEIARSYRDEGDLAGKLRELDDEFDPTTLTVVVVLDEAARQRLSSSTIRRERWAFRLVLTTTFGAGPAHRFAGDFASDADALGWRRIVCDRNCDRAVREVLRSTRQGEACVVFRPW